MYVLPIINSDQEGWVVSLGVGQNVHFHPESNTRTPMDVLLRDFTHFRLLFAYLQVILQIVRN